MKNLGALRAAAMQKPPCSLWIRMGVKYEYLFHKCDGQFYVSPWLGHSPQLLHQLLIAVLPWRYFVDVVNIYNQLILRKGNYSW